MDGISINAGAMAAKFESRMKQVAAQVRQRGSKATRDQMTATRQTIVDTTPVDSGRLRGNWGGVEQGGDDLTWQVRNDTPYAGVLEYGGYRGVGPLTVQLGGGDLGLGFAAGGGIYSKQAPLGWVRRALAASWDPWALRLMNAVRQAWAGTGAPLDVSASPISVLNQGPSPQTIDITKQLLNVGQKIRRSRQRSVQRGMTAQARREKTRSRKRDV